MKKTVRLLSLMLAVLFVFAMVGCNPEQNNNQETKTTDKPAEGDNTVKPVILAVSFGTSYNDSRDKTIGAIEDALKTAYPDYEVRRAFTSQIIIDKLKERDNLTIDNVTEALDRLVADGVKEVVIQPTHVMSGYEYDDVIKEVNKYNDKFDSVKISKNLLAADSDYDALVEILVNTTADYNAEGTAIVYMGHGTEHEANATYAKLQEKMTAAGHSNYFIGTVEATPSVEDVIALVKAGEYNKVVLLPLMIVAGDHANNDMAGDEEDSWKTLFKNEGFEVECVIRGLGELADVQQLIVKHCGEAMGK
ncbi:MAG: sirohydrochlorin cobaltochelatase [Clostridia bacterium]|nr:sirohydrochlorin cobaltochelatase [Clostridia bacterium]